LAVAQLNTSSLAHEAQLYGVVGEQGFGLKVQVEGDRMMVGVGTATPFPKVRVFDRIAGVWTPSGALSTNLVYDFDFDGDLAVAGEITGASVERMGVHRRINGTWVNSFYSAPLAGAQIGRVVALHGNTIVASSFSYDGALTDQGAVFVFENSGAQLNLVATFLGGGDGARLGQRLAIEGERILASVQMPNGAAEFRSFLRGPSGWQVESNYSGLATSFNTAVALSQLDWGDDGLGLATVRVGSSDGKVIVFGRSLSGWFTEAVIPLGVPPLGYDFSLDDGVLAMGNADYDGAHQDSGAVRLWARHQGWRQMDVESPPNSAQSLWFGAHVHVRDGKVYASAVGDDFLGFNHGVVHQLGVTHSPASVVCFAAPHSGGCVARIAFTGAPSASSGSGFVLSASSTRPAAGGALLFGVNGLSSPLLGGGPRCVAPPRAIAAPQNTGGFGSCDGTLSVDFNALLASGNYPQLLVGAQVTANFVFRDPFAALGSSATDTVQFVIGL
jgi:hypothetical protein